MKPKSIQFGDDHTGIEIAHIKDRDVLEVWMWYDTIVGTEPEEISVAEFKKRLGIS